MRANGTVLVLLALAVLSVSCEGGDSSEQTPEGGGGPSAVARFPAVVYEFPGDTWLVLAEQGPYAEFESTLSRLVGHLQEKGIQPTGELAGVYFDDPSEVDPVDTTYEIRVPVAEGTEAEPPFVVVRTESEDRAMVRLVGPYDKIRTHYATLYQWIEENGHEVAGPLWEVYLEHPGTGVEPSDFDTEIHVPVKVGAGHKER